MPFTATLINHIIFLHFGNYTTVLGYFMSSISSTLLPSLNVHQYYDRFVSRHELFPIRAPLMALEHCIGPFLDLCDEDNDHRITLAEWGKCLQLDEVTLISFRPKRIGHRMCN